MTSLLTTADLAELCNVTQQTVQAWVKRGMITYVRLPSGGIRFRPEDINQALQTHQRQDGERRPTKDTPLKPPRQTEG